MMFASSTQRGRAERQIWLDCEGGRVRLSAMRTPPDGVRLRDARSERAIELTKIAHYEPMHPQPLRVRRDPRKRWRMYRLREIEETGQITTTRRHACEAANGTLERDRSLRDPSLVGAAGADEPLERLEQHANRLRLVT